MTTNGKLPEGWTWTSISVLANSMKNGLYKEREFYADSGTPCLRMYNIEDGQLVLQELKYLRLTDSEIEEYGLLPGDLLVNRVNSRELVGKACAIPECADKFVFESKNIRLRLNPALANPRYINLRLLQVGRSYFIGNAQQTVGMASVNQEQLGNFPVPLAPRAEQDRIVARIDELLSDLDAGVSSLKRAQSNLKKYRAAVLKAAVTGELTAEWRAKHRNVEPASKLLDRIMAERRRKWEVEQETKFAATRKPPPKNWQKKYPEPFRPDTTNLPELPSGWCWVTVSMLADECPQNGAYYPKQMYGAGSAIIRIDDYQSFSSRDSSELQRVNCPKTDLAVYGVQVGDLLINRVNSPSHLGKCLLIEPRHIPSLFESNMMRLRLVGHVDAGFVRDYLRSSDGKGKLVANAKWAVNQASINQQDVLATPVPFPPLAEQNVVVVAVANCLSVIVATAAYIDASLKRASRLRQSILKEAFAGRLVPQDPNDEPASVLLERIRSQSAGNGASSPRSRSQRSKTLFEDSDGQT